MQMKSTDQLAHAALPLSDYLCFAVYSANLAFGKAYKPILEELGLTYTQYITIIALWEEDNQTVSGLGEKLFLESNTLTPILKKLEVMGYLERQREKALKMDLTAATGLAPDEFEKVQKVIVTLRNNLIKAVQSRE
jgi:predicted transcriptional regulator